MQGAPSACFTAATASEFILGLATRPGHKKTQKKRKLRLQLLRNLIFKLLLKALIDWNARARRTLLRIERKLKEKRKEIEGKLTGQ